MEILVQQTEREAIENTIGQIQMAAFIGKSLSLGYLKLIKEFKDNKLYRSLSDGINTWETVCPARFGRSHKTIERELSLLDDLGPYLLDLSEKMKLSKTELMLMHSYSRMGEIEIDEDTIMIGDEKIKITEDNAHQIKALIEDIKLRRQEERREAHLKIKGQEETIDQHSRTIGELKEKIDLLEHGKPASEIEKETLRLINQDAKTLIEMYRRNDPARSISTCAGIKHPGVSGEAAALYAALISMMKSMADCLQGSLYGFLPDAEHYSDDITPIIDGDVWPPKPLEKIDQGSNVKMLDDRRRSKTM